MSRRIKSMTVVHSPPSCAILPVKSSSTVCSTIDTAHCATVGQTEENQRWVALAKFLFESGLELEQAAVCASRIGKRCGHCPTRNRFVKEACSDGCLRQGGRGQSGPQLLYTFADDSYVRSGKDVNFMEVAALLAMLSESPMRVVRRILGQLPSSVADGTEHSAEHNGWSSLANVHATIPLFIYFCKWLSGLRVFPPLQWSEGVKIELSDNGIPLPRLLGGLKRITGGDRVKANEIERALLVVISNLSATEAITNGNAITRQIADASLGVSTHKNIMEQSSESVTHLYKCLILTEKDIEEIFEPIRGVKDLNEPLLDSDSAIAVVDLLRQFTNAVGKAGDSLMHALQDINPDDLWNTSRKYGRKVTCRKTKKK